MEHLKTETRDGQSDPLLNNESTSEPDVLDIKTTTARWWILLVYSLLAICQSCTWNIFSPIDLVVKMAYPSWTSTFINWLINSANISFALGLYPASRCIKWYWRT